MGKDMPWTLESALAMVRVLKSKFKPGTPGKAYYSDTNYQLLGGIIERLRGKKIGEVFQQEIFEPLGLKNTYLFEVGWQDSALVPLHYQENPLHIPQAMASFGPDGGIVSDSRDSARFLRAFFQGEIFPAEYLSEMSAEYNRIFFPLRYGVGLMMFQLPAIFTLFRKFPELLGHSGLSGAFSFYSPKLDLYFTGTLNQIAARGASYQMLVKCLQALS
jgi:CubicO group peptidase (beta-lactamase class C family)